MAELPFFDARDMQARTTERRKNAEFKKVQDRKFLQIIEKLQDACENSINNGFYGTKIYVTNACGGLATRVYEYLHKNVPGFSVSVELVYATNGKTIRDVLISPYASDMIVEVSWGTADIICALDE